MVQSGIYQIKSRVKPERIYIGSAVNISNRWWRHLNHLKLNKHRNIKLQRHYDKYGESDFQFSILLGCDKEDLIKVEQYFFDSYKPWFNINMTAKSNFGRKFSEEHKRKISEGNKGKHNNRIYSKDTRSKMRTARIKWMAKTGWVPPLKGKVSSDEIRKKIIDGLKKYYKKSGFHPFSKKGIKISEEQKRKISNSLIEYNKRKRMIMPSNN